MNKDLASQRPRAKVNPIFFAEAFLGMGLHDGQKKYLIRAIFGVPELIAMFDDLENQKPEVVEIRELAKELLGIEPGQNQLMRRFLLSCANRWGKSAVISVLQLWYLFNKFGIRTKTDSEWFDIEFRTANIAPFASLTEPVFQAMKAIMTSSYPIRGEDGMMTTNKCEIEWFFIQEKTLNSPPYKLFFANNSYIEHLSLMGGKGDNLQGKPYGLITYDEAPRSDHLQLELDNSILGRLLDWTAALHLLGTPDQDSNSLLYYNDLYKEGLVGLNNSYTQEGSIYENKFMTREQIADHETMLDGNPLKDQMLHGKFIFGTRNIFDAQDILDAETDELNDGKRYIEGHRYVVGVDTAIGSDEMVYCVLDVTKKPYELVWMEAVKGNSRSPQMHLYALCNLIDSYRQDNNIEMVIETWNGESARFYQDLPPYIRTFPTPMEVGNLARLRQKTRTHPKTRHQTSKKQTSS